MSKRNRSLLRRELDELPLEEMVQEALTGVGHSHRCCDVFAGSVPCIVIVAVGPAAEAWLEISDSYQRALAPGGVASEQEQAASNQNLGEQRQLPLSDLPEGSHGADSGT